MNTSIWNKARGMARVALTLAATIATTRAGERPYFTIQVVDEETHRGVPLVELTTVNHLRLVTDSQGVVAFHEPGLMGQSVFFHVKSHGYEFPKDGFGYRGKALKVTEGGEATLTIKRLNVAERLYRVTGGGVYRDSVLVGRATPTREPTLNGLVLGSDSVVNAILGGKLLWFWGDTNRPAYPLGNFHVPGATSSLPGRGGLDPGVGVDLIYRVDPQTGFAAETARLPGPGPTWIGGPSVVKDENGRDQLFVHYVKIKAPMETYERGLARFDEATGRFERDTVFPLEGPVKLGVGPTFEKTYDGRPYIVYALPYPLLRVPANPAALRDPAQYEAFTCLRPGTRPEEGQVERADDGLARFAWKTNAYPVGPSEQGKLVRSGALKDDETILNLRDVATGKSILAHGGSVCWNPYRRRWVMITLEAFGNPSFLGEIWYAEADAPLGPWVYARKVVSHEKYSFYNPKQHPYFDQDGGRTIYFEGTYTTTFSGNNDPTPRYDYNQIMYKLVLDDPRLDLPVPIYRLDDRFAARAAGHPVAWFALERPSSQSVPILEGPGGRWRTGQAGENAFFHALPADLEDPPAPTAPLFEFTSEGGRTTYAIQGQGPPNHRQAERPLCRVWVNPSRVVPPAD